MTRAEAMQSAARGRTYTFVFRVADRFGDNHVAISASNLEQAKLEAASLRRLHGWRLRLMSVVKPGSGKN